MRYLKQKQNIRKKSGQFSLNLKIVIIIIIPADKMYLWIGIVREKESEREKKLLKWNSASEMMPKSAKERL